MCGGDSEEGGRGNVCGGIGVRVVVLGVRWALVQNQQDMSGSKALGRECKLKDIRLSRFSLAFLKN